LLQAIAGHTLEPGPLTAFRLTGDILFDNSPADRALQSYVAFVEQDDEWHLPTLTVRETLHYAAMLRLPSRMSRQAKVARAEKVLLLLGLKDCANVKVGGVVVKGISGGEKRRLSLAVQSESC
jgi:ABC-type multidrug transport system ATPase subunit